MMSNSPAYERKKLWGETLAVKFRSPHIYGQKFSVTSSSNVKRIFQKKSPSKVFHQKLIIVEA
jgi:hypothetical protein